MPTWLWFTLSALAGVGLALWSYGGREEPVPGRTGPAILRGVALFFLLAGVRLPSIGSVEAGPRGPLILLDQSTSMLLPSRPGGPSRYDSALSLLPPGETPRLLTFGEQPAYVSVDSLSLPSEPRSRLSPALEAASLAGSDSVIIVGDGEWDDPSQAADLAMALGLGVREERVSAAVPRIGLHNVVMPDMAVPGDTVRVSFELVRSGPDREAGGAGESGDSVRVRLRGPDADAEGSFPVPAPGRSVVGRLLWAPEPSASAGSEWREYELSLAEGADPYSAADRAPLLLEVVQETATAVLVSESPDWETSFLLPVLDRVAPGGSTAYVRTGPERYARVGREPSPVSAAEVRRAVGSSRLLAVQGVPDSFPGWLRETLRGHARKMLMLTRSGAVPGVSVDVGPQLEGEWYAEPPEVPTPTSPLLSGVEVADLPPIAAVPTLTGDWSWSALLSRRERRGEARPLAVVGGGTGSRWALVVGTGYWRWAFRGGSARRAYEGLFGGLAGWLLEGMRRRPVDVAGRSIAGRPIRWRVGSAVTDLEIKVYDGDTVVWTGSWPEPRFAITGPALDAGRLSFEATGVGADGRFRVRRPFLILRTEEEYEPRAQAAMLSLAPRGAANRGARTPHRRAIWPFAAAIALFASEWIWRRRIGLR